LTASSGRLCRPKIVAPPSRNETDDDEKNKITQRAGCQVLPVAD
jgi:hypothetical protein